MGHYCRICEHIKSNESFSGKGHKNYICKKCSSLDKNTIGEIDETNEIFKFLEQSNISKKNISRLGDLTCSENDNISYLSSIVLNVALVKPHKKRRIKFLAQNNRELLNKLEETGLIFAHHH